MDNQQAIERIDLAIKRLADKDFNIYFFVVDSKNVPNGSMQYIYQMALTLHKKGYNTTMLYQLEDEYTKEEFAALQREQKPYDERRHFTGVGDWLGKEYMEIPHQNISKEDWKVSPADFLFIPEVFSGLMRQTHQYNAPCKRIVIMHNFDYVTEYIPFTEEWSSYGIHDVIVACKSHEELIKDIFPYVECKIIPPYIDPMFHSPVEPKKLVVNIVSKNTNDVKKITKHFYWKYPIYKFVSFRDVRGFQKSKLAELFADSAITIWIDDDTPFGYSALESLKTDNILIGKVPNHIPEWMMTDKGLTNGAIWTYDVNDIPDILSSVIGSWMHNDIPSSLTEAREKIGTDFTYENWSKNIEELIEGQIKERTREFEEVKTQVLKNKVTKEEANDGTDKE